ncbi:hypothetical protein ACJX0J_014193, partial [Zea mays]
FCVMEGLMWKYIREIILVNVISMCCVEPQSLMSGLLNLNLLDHFICFMSVLSFPPEDPVLGTTCKASTSEEIKAQFQIGHCFLVDSFHAIKYELRWIWDQEHLGELPIFWQHLIWFSFPP